MGEVDLQSDLRQQEEARGKAGELEPSVQGCVVESAMPRGKCRPSCGTFLEHLCDVTCRISPISVVPSEFLASTPNLMAAGVSVDCEPWVLMGGALG